MTRKRNSDSDLVISTPGTSATTSRRKGSSKARAKHAAIAAEPASSDAAAVTEISAVLPDVPAVDQSPAVEAVAVIPEVVQPLPEAIAELAYLYWEARGCEGGNAEEDWLRAEAELRQRARAATA